VDGKVHLGQADAGGILRQAADGERSIVRPWAGITVQPVDGPLAEALGMDLPQGVLISAMHPLSPFAEAGVDIGDVVTSVGGRAVDGGPEMLFRLLTLGVGGSTDVGILRGGEAFTTEVRLAPAPEEPPRDHLRIRAKTVLDGLEVANINPAVINELDLPFEAEGVVVTGVDGPAVRTRLQPGDIIRRVNGQPVASTDALGRMTQVKANGWEIEFERRGQRAVVRLRGR